MKIYIPSKNIKGLTEPDYEPFFASGFSAGYEDGYESYPCERKTPLTFDIISGGTIYWKGTARTIEYKKNKGEWVSITAEANIDVKAGDTLEFRGNNISYSGNRFGSDDDCRFSIRGNIMSLINASSYPTLTSVSPSAFYALFQNSPGQQGSRGLCDASNLLLPATTLGSYCYYDMFYCCEGLTAAPELPATALVEGCYRNLFKGCKSLTTAPSILPATTLANYCYEQMFEVCTSLTEAPELPATTLANYCYRSMFAGCTSLTKAPELTATTLANSCYDSMFQGCTSLNYIKCLATNISASNYTYYWVEDVASTGTFVKDPNATWDRGENGIPNNWTVIDAS